jgi:hypothetical protein
MRGVPVFLFCVTLMANVIPATAQTPPVPAPRPDVLSAPRPVDATFRPADVVNRILSFDRNRDGRIAKEELPERMELLIERADQDGDRLLTDFELRTIADPFDAPVKEPRRVQSKQITMVEVVGDLRLSGPKRDIALSLARGHRVTDTNLGSIAHAELYEWLVHLLDDEEYENFVAAAARANHGAVVVFVD